MNRLFVIVCLLLGLGPLAAVAGATSVYGVWRGTVGTREVMVNLKPDRCGSSYYYLRHLWSIRLHGDGPSATRWREGDDEKEGPVWMISNVDDTSLEGSWGDAKGQHLLPLRLKRVAPALKADDCNTPAEQRVDEVFNAPRLATKAPQSRAAKFKNQPYQRLSLPGTGIHTVQIPDDPHPVPRLNQRLRDWLRIELAAYYDCRIHSRPMTTASPMPYYEKRHEPMFWTKHLLVLRETYSYYCGGAYPDAGVGGYLVWDLETDKPLAPERWFRNAAGEVERWTPSPQLKRLLARRMARSDADESGCGDAVAQADSYMIYPKTAGMMFTPVLPHVARACADDVLVPWRDLWPLLNPQGSEFVHSRVQGVPR